MNKHTLKISAMLLTSLTLTGCGKPGFSILAATATIIGVEISQNPATQTPQAKLGYNRAEFAFVPTNRGGGVPSDDGAITSVSGANESGDVIMELRYGGIFDVGASSGIYQRLAVGTVAVQQAGASLMFAKDAEGTLNSETISALKAVKGIAVSNPLKNCLGGEYNKLEKLHDSENIALFNKAAKNAGFSKFNEFQNRTDTTQEQIDSIYKELKLNYEKNLCQ